VQKRLGRTRNGNPVIVTSTYRYSAAALATPGDAEPLGGRRGSQLGPQLPDLRRIAGRSAETPGGAPGARVMCHKWSRLRLPNMREELDMKRILPTIAVVALPAVLIAAAFDRVAGEAALGVVFLRRRGCRVPCMTWTSIGPPG